MIGLCRPDVGVMILQVVPLSVNIQELLVPFGSRANFAGRRGPFTTGTGSFKFLQVRCECPLALCTSIT